MSITGKAWRLIFNLWFAVGALFVIGGLVAYKVVTNSHSRRQAITQQARPETPPAQGGATIDAPQRTITQSFGTKVTQFLLPPDPPKPQDPTPAGPPPIPDAIKQQFVTAPTAISLYDPITPPPPPERELPPTYYLPSFRLIHCMLISSPETNGMEAPIIGIVLENVVNIDPEGVTQTVIPAGVEVHGMAKTDAIRDRLDGSGEWTFVWRTNAANNATELRVPALTLNRDYNPETKTYGLTEKSPGIKGRRIESVSDAQIKEILLDSLAAASRTLKDYTTSTNSLTGSVTTTDLPSAKNAALNGITAGTERFASQLDAIRKEIDAKGYYLAVLAGSEFYLYTREPVDLRKASRPRALTASALAGKSAAPSSTLLSLGQLGNPALPDASQHAH